MFLTYFKTAWVNIRKYPLYSTITIGGLGLGVAAVLLIGLYIESELSYDRTPHNRDEIFRVGFRTWQEGRTITDGPTFTAPFAQAVSGSLPGLIAYCRLTEGHTTSMQYGDKNISTESLTLADSSFFHFFSANLVEGDPGMVLAHPYSLVLTRRLARRLFGDVSPLGKTIRLDGQKEYLVTGVADDPGERSTLQYDALASLSSWDHDTTVFMGWNGGWQYQHFLRLRRGTLVWQVEEAMAAVLQAQFNSKYAGTTRTEAYLQPFSRLHLFYNEDSQAIRTNCYEFGIIALLILAISSINYVNLSVARGFGRYKEIGVRKVLGASRRQLLGQFMGETLLVTCFSVLTGAVLGLALLPACRQLCGTSLQFETGELLFVGGLMLALVLLLSLSAGAYVAFYLSGLRPVATLKIQGAQAGKPRLGMVLMVAQFTIAAALISFLQIVSLQLQHMKAAPLGYDKEHVLVLKLTGNAVQDAAPSIKTKLLSIAGVESAGALSEVPYDGLSQNGFLPEGSKKATFIHQLDADEDLLKVLGIRLVSGRYFSRTMRSDSDAYVINRALADLLDWKEPLGKHISRNGEHPVIGMIANFHFSSMRKPVGPLIVTLRPWLNRYGYLAIRYRASTNPSRLIDQIQALWKDRAAGGSLDYGFLDDTFDRLYRSEKRFKLLFTVFSGLSILLALAGVFALSLLDIRRRTKEIGVRKVLGAGTGAITSLWLWRYGRVVVLSAVLAVLPAWYYSRVWLQDYAYRIDPPWWVFGLSGLMVICVSLLVVGVLAAKAARLNTTMSLRSE